MANFKRKKPRTRVRGSKGRGRRASTYFMNSWPAWWDIVFHRRPSRRRQAHTTRAIMTGARDPDAVDWPDYRRPHRYFW